MKKFKLALLAVLHSLFLLTSADAGLRFDVPQSKFFNPAFAERIGSEFKVAPRSTFRFGGGVLLDGSASFFLETSTGSNPVSAGKIALRFVNGNVLLKVAGDAFPLDMHKGLACPVSRMILRGGKLAYTLPPETDENAVKGLEAAGLVAVKANLVAEAMAVEFKGTPFLKLIEGADFANTKPLPEDVRVQTIKAVSAAAQLRVAPEMGAFYTQSYLNSDQQVTYQVFLVKDNPVRIDIGGVPLRYYWAYDPKREGAPVLTDVRIWSVEGLTGDEQLAQPLDGSYTEGFGQYDYIVLYQVAGVFRTLAETQPEAFRRFSDAACAH